MSKIKGTTGVDTLTGTDLADKLHDLAGNDILKALAGNDYLDGGKGNDTYVVDTSADWCIKLDGVHTLSSGDFIL
jgi:Ca2+-binding RTX toxin-like protein